MFSMIYHHTNLPTRRIGHWNCVYLDVCSVACNKYLDVYRAINLKCDSAICIALYLIIPTVNNTHSSHGWVMAKAIKNTDAVAAIGSHIKAISFLKE